MFSSPIIAQFCKSRKSRKYSAKYYIINIKLRYKKPTSMSMHGLRGEGHPSPAKLNCLSKTHPPREIFWIRASSRTLSGNFTYVYLWLLCWYNRERERERRRLQEQENFTQKNELFFGGGRGVWRLPSISTYIVARPV